MTELTRTWRSPHPVDVRLTLSVLQRGTGDPTFRIDGNHVWRTTRMESGPATVVVTQRDENTVEARAWGRGANEHLETLPHLLGETDTTEDFRPSHPVLRDAHRRFPGLRTPRTGRVIESLIPAIIEQRVLGLDAFAAQRRLLYRLGEPAHSAAPPGMRVPPPAAAWAELPAWQWHRAGVDPGRYRAAQAVARIAASLQRLADEPPALYRALRSVPGVGVWTAGEVGARALGDADAVSWGDYHLAPTVGAALVGRPFDDDQAVAEALEDCRPHRGRAVRLLTLSPHARPERRGPRMPRVDHRAI